MMVPLVVPAAIVISSVLKATLSILPELVSGWLVSLPSGRFHKKNSTVVGVEKDGLPVWAVDQILNPTGAGD